MVLPTLTNEGFLGTLVVLLDYWIVVLLVLGLGYLLYRLPRLMNKRVAVTYVVFMALTVFWSIRNVARHLLGQDQLVYLSAISLVVNIGVIAFISYLFYRYSQLRDIDRMLGQFDLQAAPEDTGEEQETDEEDGDGQGIEYPNLAAGRSYLVLERGGEHGLELFREAVSRSPGLCFSYKNPDLIRQRHGLENTPIVWFSGNERLGDDLNTMDPTRLDVLEETVVDFVTQQREKGLGVVVIIDGAELLLYNNRFTRFMSTIEKLVDRFEDADDVTMLVSLEEERIDDHQRSLLQQELDEMRRAPSENSALQ